MTGWKRDGRYRHLEWKRETRRVDAIVYGMPVTLERRATP